MNISNERKNEIISAFQRSFKHDNRDVIESFSLEELRRADEMHGNSDLESGFRIALRNQIRRLEEREQRRFDGKVRAGYAIVGIISAILSGIAVYYLTN